MKARLYLETTIVQHLASEPGDGAKAIALCDYARRWWEKRLTDFEVFVSQSLFVELEADRVSVPELLRSQLTDLPVLSLTPAADKLSRALIFDRALRASAKRAADHIAVAAVHEMEFLLTLDYQHIANAANRRNIEAVCTTHGFTCPAICIPPQLMGEHAEDDPIVAEVREARRKLSAEHGDDPRRFFAHLREREAELRRSAQAKFYEPPSSN